MSFYTSSPVSSTPSSPRGTPSPLSGLSSPSSSSPRLPRVRSRPRLTPRPSLDRIAEEASPDADPVAHATSAPPASMMVKSPSSPALARVKDQWDGPGSVNYAGTEPKRRSWRPPQWNGKRGIAVGHEMKESCGICFETAVKPNKTRCCGQLFCFQHLSDWLSNHGSDGRCPTCRVPCSLEHDTIYLHPPPRILAPRPNRRRSTSAGRSRRPAGAAPQHRPSSPEPSSSTTYDSSASSSSDSEHAAVRGRRQTAPALLPALGLSLSVPMHAASSEQLSSLSPVSQQPEEVLLRGAARALTLVGGALVLGALLY